MTEQEVVTVELTVFSLLYAMSAATIISLILIPYPLMALIVMLTVGQILFGVMGYVSLWGLSLNITAMMSMILAVGFSVDNAAHFCHSFMMAPLKTDGVTIFLGEQNTMNYSTKNERKARVLYALNAVGMPILNGNVTTMIGLAPLAMAQSEIVLSLFKVLTLVMIFGMWHSMIYLPVLLSLIGPLGRKKSDVFPNASSTTPTPGSKSIPSSKPHHPVNTATTTVSAHHVDELMKEVAVDDGESTKLHTERAQSLEIIKKVCSESSLTVSQIQMSRRRLKKNF